jgi:hypothetical protein
MCEIIRDSGDQPIGNNVPWMVWITLTAEPEFGISPIRRLKFIISPWISLQMFITVLIKSHQYTALRRFLISSQLPRCSGERDRKFCIHFWYLPRQHVRFTVCVLSSAFRLLLNIANITIQGYYKSNRHFHCCIATKLLMILAKILTRFSSTCFSVYVTKLQMLYVWAFCHTTDISTIRSSSSLIPAHKKPSLPQ